MKFIYEDWRGKHTITLKRACPEWINSDCPEITTEVGDTIFKTGINGVNDLPLWALENGTAQKLINFIIKSDLAFGKKYPEIKELPLEKTCLGSDVEAIKEMIKRGY